MIVGFGYEKEVGKDTAADYLVEKYGFKKIGFSDFLYEEIAKTIPATCQEIFKLVYGTYPVGDDLRWALMKNPRHPVFRRLLQEWGTELRRTEDPNYWTKKMSNAIRLIPWGERKVVINNVRFLNEARMLRQDFDHVTLVRLTRPGLDHDWHISDTEGAKIKWDHTIDNDGPVADLYADLDALMEKVNGNRA